MRHTRAEYHKVVRWVQRNADSIRSDKLAQSLYHEDPRDFWRMIKHLKGDSNALPNLVDDAQGPEDISNRFAGLYEELYNSVPYTRFVLELLMAEIEADMSWPLMSCLSLSRFKT